MAAALGSRRYTTFNDCRVEFSAQREPNWLDCISASGVELD
jgi:hypothetical protein